MVSPLNNLRCWEVVGKETLSQATLFVLCIEILALTIKNLKVTPYETIKGNKKLNDTYADDLTLFLKLFPLYPQKTKANIKHALDCFDKFYNWLGLKINNHKTYVNIFGKISPEPTYVKVLCLNYCNDFTLLGIKLDSTLNLWCAITKKESGSLTLLLMTGDISI